MNDVYKKGLKFCENLRDSNGKKVFANIRQEFDGATAFCEGYHSAVDDMKEKISKLHTMEQVNELMEEFT